MTTITTPDASHLEVGCVVQLINGGSPMTSRQAYKRVVAINDQHTVTVCDLTDWQYRRWVAMFQLKRWLRSAWRWICEGIAEAGQMYGRGRP